VNVHEVDDRSAAITRPWRDDSAASAQSRLVQARSDRLLLPTDVSGVDYWRARAPLSASWPAKEAVSERGHVVLKKNIFVLFAVAGVLALSGAGLASAGATAKFAAKPAMTAAVTASSSFPTKCPPAAPVGKALGLHVTGPTVVAHVAGMALECQYKSAKLKTTLTWVKQTSAEFLSLEKTVGAKPITGLGKGVLAYSNASVQFAVQKGTLGCTISAFGFKLAQMEALAKLIVDSYW
jgi:hypothetical protein